MSRLSEIRKLKAEYEKKIKKEGKSILKEEFGAFFAANPTVKAIRWEQYTPYFNDGDACEFGVNEFRYRFDDTPKDDGDYEDGFLSTYSIDDSKVSAELSKFERSVKDDDVMLAVFGDHVEVTATRGGFKVEEYSHD